MTDDRKSNMNQLLLGFHLPQSGKFVNCMVRRGLKAKIVRKRWDLDLWPNFTHLVCLKTQKCGGVFIRNGKGTK